MRLLREAILTTRKFCLELGSDAARIESTRGFERIDLLDDAEALIVVNDDTTRRYLS